MNSIPTLTTTFRAQGAVAKRRLVALAAATGLAVQASAATDAIAGVSTDIDSPDGRPCDVIRSGIAPVVYGNTVTAGQPITSDAQGKAIAATAGQRIVGFAEVSGVAGDIGAVHIAPGFAA
ncbi:MAG: DUF2190 family protein [Pseudomonadota bacterium]|nr:DUF2190 family protein [Pseudomonadota bacterium]